MKIKTLQTLVKLSKLTFYILCSICLSLTSLLAEEGKAQVKSVKEVQINIHLSQVSLSKALKTIEERTDFNFIVSKEKINLNQKINLAHKSGSVEEILLDISKQANVRFQQINENIDIRKIDLKESKTLNLVEVMQDVEVSGKITDENGEGLPGASVVVKGTSSGTTTDIDGNYKLTAPESAILTISFVGYSTQEVAIGAKSVIDIQMQLDAAQLEEVVVVGYGTVQKKDLTGAVTSVKGDDMEKTPANTFVQSLQGRSAGVDIKAASNAPGGGIRIRIRGTNSINASSDPLYVIDGFPIDNVSTTPQGAGNSAQSANPLSSISPSEIASIEVLKDASATAIYGARGANGVVIITTKRGEQGKAQINFDYSLDIASVRKKLDLANAEELAILNNEWATNNGQPLIYDGINKPLPEELGEGTDWQDEIFRTALTHTYNLSISGGTENTKYLLSGNYMDQNGIIIESNFKRVGIKFNLDQKVSNRIKLGFNMNANRSVNDAVPSDGSGYQNDTPLWNALATTPVIPVRDADGNYVHNHDETTKILENPVAIAETRTDITYTNRTLTNVFKS
ncbi:SusC/RagA family TonB-linked outer membrane protein [Reichenbachiella sp. MALMAid0571]|uniref:SusC/RagA family TonB-linked outer membrane protein n=1 Tax=Reichenbachiella sp. MALMAid0571 TaxID=3143939 RepID=UPI0032DF0FEE